MAYSPPPLGALAGLQLQVLLPEGKVFSFPIDPGAPPGDHKLQPLSRCHLFSEDSASLLSSVQADRLCGSFVVQSQPMEQHGSVCRQTATAGWGGWLCGVNVGIFTYEANQVF